MTAPAQQGAPDNMLDRTLRQALQQVMERRLPLEQAEAHALLEAVLEAPEATGDPRLPALLGALAARGETAGELAGFAQAMRARAAAIPLQAAERATLVDTCGTGGDGTGTFNLSTAAALVAASAGARVAKHGNRAVTSRAGSADVLEALGIPVDLSPEATANALRRHGFAFLAAPLYHPALARLQPLRRALGVRTAFNLLGPLSNPAGAPAQVVGVYAPWAVPVVAGALARLGTRHALVVHGGGLDEFSPAGPTTVCEVQAGSMTTRTVTPAELGLKPAPLSTLAGGDAHTNAMILRSLFAGERGPRQDAVLLNTAPVLLVAGLVRTLPEGVEKARHALDTGRTAALVDTLAQHPTLAHAKEQ